MSNASIVALLERRRLLMGGKTIDPFKDYVKLIWKKTGNGYFVQSFYCKDICDDVWIDGVQREVTYSYPDLTADVEHLIFLHYTSNPFDLYRPFCYDNIKSRDIPAIYSSALGNRSIYGIDGSLNDFILRSPTVMDVVSSSLYVYESDSTRIFVPDNIVDEYKAHSVWGGFSAYIHPLSEY